MGTTSHYASVLAIDTATNLCSVALVNDADIKEIQRDLPRAHNQHILTMIDELLEGQSLSEAVSVIACGVGPGSFTGIRVAVGVAQGLGWSLDLPIYPFCSLEAQARATAELLDAGQLRLGELVSARELLREVLRARRLLGLGRLRRVLAAALARSLAGRTLGLGLGVGAGNVGRHGWAVVLAVVEPAKHDDQR